MKCLESLFEAVQQFELLRAAAKDLPSPMGELLVTEYDRDPFVLLIACILSLRARDKVVHPVVRMLCGPIRDVYALASCPREQLEKILKPIGFYRVKAATLHAVAHALIARHGGRVPQDIDDLRALPGVGPKTVAFMMCYVYQKPALCVDTHVHRLANLFRWVTTSKVEATESALAVLFPPNIWRMVNTTLVSWGQNVCGPRGVAVQYRALHERICPCRKSTP